MTASGWVASAKRNACDLQRENLAFDYAIVANWSLMEVRNVPESDSATLTSFLTWFERPHLCSR